jgi:hypothetical protein
VLVLLVVPLGLFLLAFVVIFAEDQRAWVAEEVLGCDGPVITEESDADASEPTMSFSCDIDGERTVIDVPLALVAFGPFLVLVVLPGAIYAAVRAVRSRRRSGSGATGPR